MSGAALSAYRAAVAVSRKKDNKNLPQWMQAFRERMPELLDEDLAENKQVVKAADVRQADFDSSSKMLYDRISWFLYVKVVATSWFEGFVMLNILLIGIATGLDLQYEDEHQRVSEFVNFASMFTLTVFTLECGIKLVSEGRYPYRFFTDEDNGYFNTFDFAIVVTGLALLGAGGDEKAVGALRMLRLVRLLSFVKGVPQLRVIVAGLIQGMKSVSYICMLLILVIYICAILTCLFFGRNDPARFGTVAKSMLTLFQVSTMASWTATAYTTFFGCSKYISSPYGRDKGLDNPSMVHTMAGSFEGFRCPEEDEPQPVAAFFFFQLYIILTAWVIMSLFIGVITMGMFESFEAMKEEQKEKRYVEKMAQNNDLNSPKRDEFIQLIHNAIVDVKPVDVVRTPWMIKFEAVSAWCKKNRDSAWFGNMVTITILVVGVMIGIETDIYMSCERYNVRENRPDKHPRCEVSIASMVVTYLSQAIFTFEMGVKILAEKYVPAHYFKDPWNCMDSFVVLTGFIEMSPLSFIFASFPVVILRLLRLLRVFRLAKTLPRLRSIVEALIQGFGAVGWICVLIVVFNYIIACMFMLFLKSNDPFHFGTIPFAMFNVLRISTLDSWDQMLGITMLGCDEYPQGFDFTVSQSGGRCENSKGLGWVGGILMLIAVIFNSFILPTVLIGIVAISFDEATRRAANYNFMLEKMDIIIKDADAKMPGYFNEEKMAQIKHVFEEMDADGGLALDMNEMCPFYMESFKLLFDVNLKHKQMEGLFHLIDADGSGELGFAEFVMFIVVVKQIEAICKKDPFFAKRTFDPAYYHTSMVTTETPTGLAKSGKSLNSAVPINAGKPPSSHAETKERPRTPPRVPRPPQEKRPATPPKMKEDRPKTPSRAVGAAPEVVDPYPDEDFDPSLIELVRSRCSAIARKFLPDDHTDQEHQDLSQRLFKRFTAEMLLAQRIHLNTVDDQLSEFTQQMASGIPMPSSKSPGKKGLAGFASDAKESRKTAAVNPIHGFQPLALQQDLSKEVLISKNNKSDSMAKPKKQNLEDESHTAATSNEVPRLNTVWKAVVQHLESSSVVVGKIEEAFEASQCDNAKGGLVDIQELSILLKNGGINLNDAGLALFCDDLNVGNNGKVSFELFFIALQKYKDVVEFESPSASAGPASTNTLVNVWAAVIELLELQPEAAVRVEEAFESASESADGNLDIDELLSVFTSYKIKLAPGDLQRLHRDLDASNKTGRVSLEEFLATVQSNKTLFMAYSSSETRRTQVAAMPLLEVWAAIISLLELHPDAAVRIEEAFEGANISADGFLDIEELMKVFTSYKAELQTIDMQRLRSCLNTNNNGQISLNKFLEMVQKNKAHIVEATSEAERNLRHEHLVKVWKVVIELLELQPEAAVRVEKSFESASESSDGYLGIEELLSVFSVFQIKLAPDGFQILRDDLDTNNSGRISLNEFLNAVQTNKQLVSAMGSGR